MPQREGQLDLDVAIAAAAARARKRKGEKFGDVQGFGMGVADGLTFNTTDEIIGGMAYLDEMKRQGHEVVFDAPARMVAKPAADFLSPLTALLGLPFAGPKPKQGVTSDEAERAASLRARAEIDNVRGAQQAARETAGGTYLAGNIVGGLGTGGGLNGVVKVGGQVGNAAARTAARVPGVTQVARAAGTVTKPLANVASKAGRAIGKIPGGNAAMRAIATGAPAGAGYAALSAAGDATDDRVMAALNAMGPGAGYGAGFGLLAKGGASTVGFLANLLGRSPDKKAVATLARMMSKAKRTPQEAADEVRARARGGNEVFETAAEFMGPQAEGMQTALGTVTGPAQEHLRNQFTRSIRNMRNNINRSAKSVTGKDPERFHQAKRDHEQMRLERDAKQYGQVLGDPMGPNRPPMDAFTLKLFNKDPDKPHLQPVGFRPVFQKYVKSVLDDAKSNGDFMAKELSRFHQLITQRKMPVRALSTRAINEIDKRIGQDIEVAVAKGRKYDAAQLMDLREALRVIDFDTGLGAIREDAAIGISAQQAFDKGRLAFQNQIDVEDVIGTLKDFPPEIADNYLTGMVRQMSDKLANQRNLGGLADAANEIAATPAMREKLLAALPTTQAGKPTANARRFLDLLDRVSRHTNRARMIFGNSATAPRQAAIQEAEAEAGPLSADVVDFIGELITRQGGKISEKIGAHVRDRVTRPGIYNPRINEELGKRLGAQGKQDILGVLDEVEAWNNRPTPVLSTDRMVKPSAQAAGFQAGTASAAVDPYARDAAGARATEVVDGLERPLIEEYLRPGTTPARRAEIEALFGADAQGLRALLLEPAY